MKAIGFFSGIGGIEKGLERAGHHAQLLVEIDPACSAVLRQKFPDVPLKGDISLVEKLPEADLIAAGFPCQDLSQAGRTTGIGGAKSSVVAHVFRLLSGAELKPNWVLFENVPFMLQLQRGKAMRTLIANLESLGYRWAYRIVDARAFGLPQRRRRVILLASLKDDPKDVLFSDDAGTPDLNYSWASGRGFYWTEGRTGLGWAVGAIPTLKGGSALGIPSPPAIWFPRRRTLETPTIRDAERLQGFEPDWTIAAETVDNSRGARWRLVGNSVCVPMMEWLGTRLNTPGRYYSQSDRTLTDGCSLPTAGWGGDGRFMVASVSEWPKAEPLATINSFLKYGTSLLSLRAARGFYKRATADTTNLRINPEFLADVAHHISNVE